MKRAILLVALALAASLPAQAQVNSATPGWFPFTFPGFDSSPTAIDLSSLQALLTPQYIETIPVLDGWKKDYQYFLDPNNPLNQQVMLIGSGGRDRSTVSGTYTVAGFDPTDYDQDIVWADGFFVRWPQK